MLALIFRPDECPWQFLSKFEAFHFYLLEIYPEFRSFSPLYLFTLCSTAHPPSILLCPFSLFQSFLSWPSDKCAQTHRTWMCETECDGRDGEMLGSTSSGFRCLERGIGTEASLWRNEWKYNQRKRGNERERRNGRREDGKKDLCCLFFRQFKMQPDG